MFEIYDDKYIADRLGVEKRHFHCSIKPLIKRDFKAELKEKTIDNPDIGLDKNGSIYLVDPRDSKIYVKTDVNIELYK